MSLDVYLEKKLSADSADNSIEDLSTLHEEYSYFLKYITQEEFLDYEAWYKEHGTVEVYGANITHNLGNMASEAAIYDALWRPYRLAAGYDAIDAENYEAEYAFEGEQTILAKDIIKPIEKGLKKLVLKPSYYKTFDSENGWGIYDHFVPFVEKYLNALKKHPNSVVAVSR